MSARVLLLTTFLLAGLFALFLAGPLQIALEADRLHVGVAISLMIAVATYWAARGKWDTVSWIADKLPIIGLIGTVSAVLAATHEAQTMSLGNDDDRLRLFLMLAESLVANAVGIAGYFWLELMRRLCRA